MVSYCRGEEKLGECSIEKTKTNQSFLFVFLIDSFVASSHRKTLIIFFTVYFFYFENFINDNDRSCYG